MNRCCDSLPRFSHLPLVAPGRCHRTDTNKWERQPPHSFVRLASDCGDDDVWQDGKFASEVEVHAVSVYGQLGPAVAQDRADIPVELILAVSEASRVVKESSGSGVELEQAESVATANGPAVGT